MAALRLSLPVALWAVHFVAIYGFTGLACARGMDGAVPWVVGIATIVAAALAAWMLARGAGRRGDFIDATAAGLAGLALIAIAWEGLPALWVTPCALR